MAFFLLLWYTMTRLKLSPALLLVLALTANAETFQVSQNGGSGTNTVAWFNMAGSWANPKVSGQIGPGDTVVLNGTITNGLTIQGRGSQENVITVLFAQNAQVVMPYPTNIVSQKPCIIYGLYLKYVKIDGGVNGKVWASDNGSPTTCTPPGTNTYHTDGQGILFYGCGTDVEICNLTVGPIYVRVPWSNDHSISGTGDSTGISAAGITNCFIHNNTITDARTAIGAGGAPNVSIYSNSIVHFAQGIGVGVTSGTATNTLIYANQLNDNLSWKDEGSDQFHSGGVHVYGVPGWASGVQIYNNRFGPVLGPQTTSAIFCEGNVESLAVWNNVIGFSLYTNTVGGGIAIGVCGTNHIPVYNNTIVVFNGNGASGISINPPPPAIAPQGDIKNNLLVGLALPITMGNSTGTLYSCDYNLYYVTNAAYPIFVYRNNYQNYGNGPANWSYWLSQGFDTHSPQNIWTQDPLLDANFKLTGVSPAIRAGTALDAAYNLDAAGRSRSASGSRWDIGAFAYPSRGAAGSPPPPTGLTTNTPAH